MASISGAGGKRALWTMVDQALSSLSTAAMSIVVAKVSLDADFGRFSLAFVVYTFFIGIIRALASTPFILHHTADDPAEIQAAGAKAAGLSVLIGFFGALGVAVFTLIFGGTYTPAMLSMSLLMFGLMLQDSWRMLLVATGRPAAATLQDSLVVLLQIVAFAACIMADRTSPPAMILAWALPTTVAGLFGIRQWGVLPDIINAPRFLRQHWTSSQFLLMEYLAVQGASQLAWMLIPVLGDAKDIGALRGGMTLLGTLNIVGNSIYMFALAETLRRGVRRPRPLMRVGMAVTAVIAFATVVFGLILVVLPDSVGTALLGATWVPATVTFVPLTLYMLGVAFSTGPQTIMRARADTRSTFRVNLFLGPLMLISVCLGQYLGGAEGAAWGFAVATVLTAPMWWAMAHRSAHRPRRAMV